MKMELSDRVTIDAKETRLTTDGYLVTMPRVARTGIQLYGGDEVGKPEMQVVRVYRPENEVFSADSMSTFAYRPITDDHPKVPVTSKNWRDFAKGQSGGEVARDGEFLRVPMVVMDQAVIEKVKDGKEELSVGYSCDLKWESGVTGKGEQYDAIQTDIRANHIAIVSAARGGAKLRIGNKTETSDELNNGSDSADKKETEMSDAKMTVMDVDGIKVEMSDTAVQVVSKTLKTLGDSVADLTKKLADAAKATADAKTATDAAIAKLTTDLAARDAEIVTLKKQVEDAKLSPDKLDQLVKDREAVIGKAKAMLGDSLKVEGQSIAQIQRQVVDAKLADKAKGWSDEQVAVSFDTLSSGVVAQSGVHDAARAFSQPAANTQDRAKMYADADKRLSDAWKTPKVA